MTETEVFEIVKQTLVEALALDDDEVTPETTLTGNPDAESIDFLDIVSRLMKSFDIKTPHDELFPDKIVNNPDFVEDGCLTGAGMEKLKKRMPRADFTDFEQDPNINNMGILFTVQTIVDSIVDCAMFKPGFVKDGCLTEAGMKELKDRMPHADFTDFEQDPNVNNVGALFTVQTIVDYVTFRIVFEKVRDTLVDALVLDDDEVTPGATLTGDLGAESIDFLDIVFRLEKSFGIKIPRGELFPDNIVNNPDFVTDGHLTEAGMKQLKERMPHADFTDFEQDPNINNMGTLFTVRTIVNYVMTKTAG